jgi:hypothetical protein
MEGAGPGLSDMLCAGLEAFDTDACDLLAPNAPSPIAPRSRPKRMSRGVLLTHILHLAGCHHDAG